jgi:hypothetical protein
VGLFFQTPPCRIKHSRKSKRNVVRAEKGRERDRDRDRETESARERESEKVSVYVCACVWAEGDRIDTNSRVFWIIFSAFLTSPPRARRYRWRESSAKSGTMTSPPCNAFFKYNISQAIRPPPPVTRSLSQTATQNQWETARPPTHPHGHTTTLPSAGCPCEQQREHAGARTSCASSQK